MSSRHRTAGPGTGLRSGDGSPPRPATRGWSVRQRRGERGRTWAPGDASCAASPPIYGVRRPISLLSAGAFSHVYSRPFAYFSNQAISTLTLNNRCRSSCQPCGSRGAR